MSIWRQIQTHRNWLMQQADGLFDFYQFTSINPKGGFFALDDMGAPAGDLRQLHLTTRMIHCFAIAHLMGRPGADAIIDHGLNCLWQHHRDQLHGGYFWSFDDRGVKDGSKQAYGHAFVLLAASGAKVAGHPLADRILSDVSGLIGERFWEEQHGAVREEFATDWSEISTYRGQNSNMHLTEALMAAFEATSDATYLRKAERIATLIIGRHAKALGYRVAEHFDENWNVDNEYRGSDVFRPTGTTPGHWLEWSRLLLQLWELGGRKLAWLPDASAKLFRNSVELGWDKQRGGLFYTLEWDNQPALRHKIWWPATEAIGAATFLGAHTNDSFYEEWYRRIWGFCANNFIDHRFGSWHHELDDELRPTQNLFFGKPDIYHALQACLIPLYPTSGSLTRVVKEAGTIRDDK